MTEELPDWAELSAAEKIDIIRPAWEDGKSAGDITWMFQNASRNAIIGAIHRAKLPKRRTTNPIPRPKPDPKPRTPRVARAVKPKPQPMAYTAPFTQVPDAEPPSASVLDMIAGNRPPLAGTTPIDILALPNRSGVLCRFPVNGGHCGVACGEKMYCSTHHAIMYRPTERLRMPKEARR